MVVSPHREGGQAQFIETPVPEVAADTLAPVLAWLQAHLDDDVTIDELAARAHLSPRTFARRFRAETGTTPHHWLIQQRLGRAELLLESTDEPVERVAVLSGFGSATTLRHHFTRRRGHLTPVLPALVPALARRLVLTVGVRTCEVALVGQQP